MPQDVSLFQQFNGRYDLNTIGNTLNLVENGPLNACDILTESSATLDLPESTLVTAAYLYWAGSGDGDLEVTLNGNPITAERTFSDALDDVRVFFSAFADVTELVQQTGNDVYTLSDFDLTNVIGPYCSTGTNFGGWAIVMIIQDDAFPLNQVNVYDGLQSVPDAIDIELTNLNVFDNVGAKIGFLAWEGDRNLSVNETLRINGNIIGNPPLNPVDNAFNGTNSFTGESGIHNMDIDFYNIQNNISIGDTSALVQLTSGQDFVMVNNIVTVLNSRLPDASSVINDVVLNCDSRVLVLDFDVRNVNSTNPLPAGTTFSIFAEDILLEQGATTTELPIGGSENQTLIITIPDTVPDVFDLSIQVDAEENVQEANEDNNITIQSVEFLASPIIAPLPELLSCDQSFNTGVFDLTPNTPIVSDNETFVGFFTSEEDTILNNNIILTPENFQNTTDPQLIYVRVDNASCFSVSTFSITTENCPPIIPDGFSPNGDSINDRFEIVGLRNIFDAFELRIYNRFGNLLYKGNNNKEDWDGISEYGLLKGSILPPGVYFYVLNLNDANYRPIQGRLYLNR